MTPAPQDLVSMLLTAFGPVGGAAVLLAAWWIYNQRAARKRAAETEDPPIARTATTLLVEKMGDLDRHVREVRGETGEIAEVARDIARISERQEVAIGRVHEICAETKSILEQVNRRLDRLEER